MSVGSLLRFMLLQLHLRIYSVLSFPYITHPAQLLTSHIHLHLHREREREDGKIREGLVASGEMSKMYMVPINRGKSGGSLQMKE